MKYLRHLMAGVLLVISASSVSGQVYIGFSGNVQPNPFSFNIGFGRDAALYKTTELGNVQSGGVITTLSWYASSGGPWINGPFKIYLKELGSINMIASDTWANTIAGATEVFSGTSNFVQGWNLFDITDYSLGAGQNLLVLVECNYGGNGTGGVGGNQIRYTNSTAATHAYWLNNTTPPLGAPNDINTQRPNIALGGLVYPPPPNNTCADAALLSCGTTLSGQTTRGASQSGGFEVCSPAKGVWYKFTGNGQIMNITIDAVSVDLNPEIGLATGSCGNLTNLACQNLNGPGATETYSFASQNGEQYYVYIGHFLAGAEAVGEFDISLNCSSCTPPTASFTYEDDCDNTNGYFVNVNITSMGSASSLTISDNLMSPPQVLSSTGSVQFGPYVQTTVTMKVQNDQEEICFIYSNELNSNTPCPPDNDNCINAISLNQNTTLSLQETYAATASGVPIPICSGNPASGAMDVWYTISTDTDGGSMTLSVFSIFNINPVIAVYEGTCNSLNLIACVDEYGLQENETITLDNLAGNTQYYIRIYSRVNLFGSFSIQAEGSVLAIRLDHFSAQARDHDNEIRWSTSSENGNAWQVLERSENGISDWQETGRVSGTNGGNAINHYRILDHQPPRMAYYRLLALDYDGKSTQSHIISVKRKGADDAPVKSIYPLPASDLINIDLLSKSEDDILQIDLLGLNGELLLSESVTAPAEEFTHTLRIDSLRPALYIVRVRQGTASGYYKLLKID